MGNYFETHKKKVYVPIIIYHKWISIFCNACGHDGFVQIMAITYIYIIIILTFYLCLLYLKLPWKKFLPFALGIVLDFITICYYKNASERIFKAIGWFYSFFFFFFWEDVLKFLVFTFAMPIAQIIFFLQFETFYTCVTYLYLPYNMYKVNDEIFTPILTLWRGQMFVI